MWSKDKPIQNGYYFYRFLKSGNVIMSNIVGKRISFIGRAGAFPLADMDGHFYGPITPPEFPSES